MASQDQAAREKLRALCDKFRKYEKYVEFLAQTAKDYGLWKKYSQPLSELYMRLKQGPIRMTVVGETSTGKSTLLNAFAGKFIAPESSGVCTPVPIWLQRHSRRTTYVNPYTRSKDRLPEVSYVISPSDLLKMQYSAKANETFQGDQQIMVYVDSDTMPEFVTLVDTPGLNANEADTEKTYALFQTPSYSPAGKKDLPEILLFLTRHENLLQTETDALKDFIDLGVDSDSCFLVYNDVRALSDVSVDTFEEVNSKAVTGLRNSFSTIVPKKETAAVTDYYSLDLDALTSSTSSEHIYSVNALLARMQSVDTNDGVYPLSEYLPAGVTLQQRDELSKQEENFLRFAEVRDQWVQEGNTGYKPMRKLVEAIEEQVLHLAENCDALEDVLLCARQLGEEIVGKCKPEKHKDFKAAPNEQISGWKTWSAMLQKNIGATTKYTPNKQQLKTMIEPMVENIRKTHNGKVEMVKTSLSGRSISWGWVLTTLAGSILIANPLPLFMNIFQLLKDNTLMKAFIKNAEERLVGEHDHQVLCENTTEENVYPLIGICNDTLDTINEQLALDKQELAQSLRDALRPVLDAYYEVMRQCRNIEKHYAKETGTAKVRKMLTEDLDPDNAVKDQATLVLKILNRWEKRCQIITDGYQPSSNQKYVKMLQANAQQILSAFNERKELFKVCAKEIMIPQLERCVLEDNEPFYTILEEVILAHTEPLRKACEALYRELGEAVARQELAQTLQDVKKYKSLNKEVQKMHQEQLALLQ